LVPNGKTVLSQKIESVEVVTDITFTPSDAKKYAIQPASGSGLGKKVVRRTFAGEVDIAKDCALTDFSADDCDSRYGFPSAPPTICRSARFISTTIRY
jgi:hypothetical protein